MQAPSTPEHPTTHGKQGLHVNQKTEEYEKLCKRAKILLQRTQDPTRGIFAIATPWLSPGEYRANLKLLAKNYQIFSIVSKTANETIKGVFGSLPHDVKQAIREALQEEETHVPGVRLEFN